MVNQESDKDSCPEEHRDDRRFRPCRKGPLFAPDEGPYSSASVSSWRGFPNMQEA
jgi:hypothetical protein